MVREKIYETDLFNVSQDLKTLTVTFGLRRFDGFLRIQRRKIEIQEETAI